MISLLKNIFFACVVIVAMALLAALVQKFYEENNMANVEPPEHPIKVPSNSRPILAPCDLEK